VLEIPPLIWARWAFFFLWFTAWSGISLPVMYFLNVRFPSTPPVEPRTVVRQALWVGVYGSLIAWIQLGHVGSMWIWTGLAAGLMAIEYLIRLRERARWRSPRWDPRDSGLGGDPEVPDGMASHPPDEPTQ